MNPEALGRPRRPPAAAADRERGETLFDVVAPGEVMLRLAARAPDAARAGAAARRLLRRAPRPTCSARWRGSGTARRGSRRSRERLGRARWRASSGVTAWTSVTSSGARAAGSAPTSSSTASRRARSGWSTTGKGSAFASLDESEVDWHAVSRSRVVHVTGITAGLGPRPRGLFERAVESARAGGALLSLDVNYRTALWTPEAARALPRAACCRASGSCSWGSRTPAASSGSTGEPEAVAARRCAGWRPGRSSR